MQKLEQDILERLKGNKFPDLIVQEVKWIIERESEEGRENPSIAMFCAHCVYDFIRRSSYVARARSVAYMVGHCRYLGRLVESYGLKLKFTGMTPGKGVYIHQLLALAVLELDDIHKLLYRPNIDLDAFVHKVIDYVAAKFDELIGSGLEAKLALAERVMGESNVEKELVKIVHPDEFELLSAESKFREEAKRKAAYMLLNLLRALKRIHRELGISLENIYLFPELQLTDYMLRIIGTPDLIIEDVKNSKAIVVEWKTGDKNPTPSSWEKVQAFIYAMLAARRLGYGGALEDSSERAEFIESVASPDKSKLKVYYMIIRPAAEPYSDHPAIRLSARTPANLYARMLLTLVASYHLTLLHCYPEEAEEENCKVTLPIGGEPKKVAAFRYTPPSLRNGELRALAGVSRTFKGNPCNPQGWPCSLCLATENRIAARACKIHFCPQGVEDDVEKYFYILRRRIHQRHEKLLEPYKLLYFSNPSTCVGIRTLASLVKLEARMLDEGKPPILIGEGGIYRFMIFDELELAKEPYYSDSVKLVKYVNKDKLVKEERGLEDITATRLLTLTGDKPIAVYIGPVSSQKAIPVTLNIPLYLAVSDIALSENALVVNCRVPSKALMFAYILLWRLLGKMLPNVCRTINETLHCKLSQAGYRAVAIESNVDLTHVDLRTLNALLLAIDDAKQRGEPPVSEYEKVVSESLQNLIRELILSSTVDTE